MDNELSLLQQCLNSVKKLSPHYRGAVVEDTTLNRVFFSLFGGGNHKWRTEITLPMVEKAKQAPDFDSVLIKECLWRILQDNFAFERIVGNVEFFVRGQMHDPVISESFLPCFTKCGEMIDSISNPIIIIHDAPRTGKTLFVKWYLKTTPENHNIFWLDFNCGNIDFVDSLFTYLTVSPSSTNYLVIDNLECCGFSDSKKTLRFFQSLVENVNELSPERRQKLIVIQDSNMPVFDTHTHNVNQGVTIFREISELLHDKDLYKEYTDISYDSVCTDVGEFISSTDVGDDAKALLVKLLFFSRNGISFVCKDSCKIELLKIAGIKITKDNELISFSSNIASRLIKKYRDAFEKVLSKETWADLSSDFLKYYYNYLSANNLKVNISDLYHILDHSRSKAKMAKTLKDLLFKAQIGASGIAEKILSTHDDEKVFNNHLGVILFSMEAMASFSSNDWNILHAIEKLKNHIRRFYIINPQEKSLPQLSPSCAKLEGTYKDFVSQSPTRSNCIENQILLQDELLSKVHFKAQKVLPPSVLAGLRGNGKTIDDSLFDLYLSPKQTGPSINMEQFYGTYILGVLFEFETTLPDELRDGQRIIDLWTIIKHNYSPFTTTDSDASAGFFYPQRIPWVSARMMLALQEYRKIPNPNHEIIKEIEEIIKGLARYLIQCSICYEDNGKRYRFWTGGTGFWNSALETSILCTFAMQKAAPMLYRNERKEGQRFIEYYSNRWFDDRMLADGIWAFRITKLAGVTKSTFRKAMSDFATKTASIDFATIPQTERNDKSLGESHIAKTFIDSVLDLIAIHPSSVEIGIAPGKLLKKGRIVKRGRQEKSSSANVKVFISYSWDDSEHKKWVKQLADDLVASGKIQVILDQNDLKYGDALPHFMEQSIEESNYVLFICTPNYKAKADQRQGCVGYEDTIITGDIFSRNNHRKYIPVLARGGWDDSTPVWARGKYGVDLTDSSKYATEVNGLIDALTRP